jgi:hypothetical protein
MKTRGGKSWEFSASEVPIKSTTATASPLTLQLRRKTLNSEIHACIPLWCSCEYYDDKDKAKKILRDRYSWFCRQEEAGMLQEMMQLDLMAVLIGIRRITRLFAVCVTYLGHDVVREVAAEVESKHSLSEEFLDLCHKTFLSESSLNKSRPQDYPCPFCLAPRSGVPTRGISTIPVTEE